MRKFETEGTDYPVCPHCGFKEQFECWGYDYWGFKEGIIVDCDKCGKPYLIILRSIPEFTTTKVDFRAPSLDKLKKGMDSRRDKLEKQADDLERQRTDVGEKKATVSELRKAMKEYFETNEYKDIENLLKESKNDETVVCCGCNEEINPEDTWEGYSYNGGSNFCSRCRGEKLTQIYKDVEKTTVLSLVDEYKDIENLLLETIEMVRRTVVKAEENE